jgi:hypothetical protein
MAFFKQIVKIRDDIVDSQHIILGKHDACIYNEDIVPVFIKDHILPNLPQAT